MIFNKEFTTSFADKVGSSKKGSQNVTCDVEALNAASLTSIVCCCNSVLIVLVSRLSAFEFFATFVCNRYELLLASFANHVKPSSTANPSMHNENINRIKRYDVPTDVCLMKCSARSERLSWSPLLAMGVATDELTELFSSDS